MRYAIRSGTTDSPKMMVTFTLFFRGSQRGSGAAAQRLPRSRRSALRATDSTVLGVRRLARFANRVSDPATVCFRCHCVPAVCGKTVGCFDNLRFGEAQIVNEKFRAICPARMSEALEVRIGNAPR